jgi:hypothetical protein
MVENYRHPHATNVVFVIGSPAPLDRAKPNKYPSIQRQHWRPQTRPPSKQRQAERIVKLMRELAKREADARSMLTPRPDLMRAWFTKAA